MLAIATLGACFGCITLAVLILFFPHWLRMRDEITRLHYELAKLKDDFKEGLQELQEQSAMPDETGVWMPRKDPITQGPAWIKQQERSMKLPHETSSVNEALEELLYGTTQRTS